MPRNSSRRSHSRNRSRTRSRSRSRSYSRGHRDSRNYRDRDRDRDRDRYRNRYDDDDDDRRNSADMCRVHVADLSPNVSKSELEKQFSKFGEIEEVWMAQNPPCFAFIVYKNRDDADEAIRDMNGRTFGGTRIRATLALPRTKGRKRRFDPNMRCYQCGERGHFSRDCNGGGGSRRRNNNRYSRSGSRGGRDRGRDRSRSRSYTRSRTGSRTPHRNGNANGETIKD